MCELQLIYKFGKEKLNEEDLKNFIKLMYLGDRYNHDAYGMFNKNYLFKAPGHFNYRTINEKKVLPESFIVGHNRFSTCNDYPLTEGILIPMNENIWHNSIMSLVFGGIRGYKLESKTKKKFDNQKDIDINENNHPFKIGELTLVHNGVITNEFYLREKYNVNSSISTDSYVILFLIDHFIKVSKFKERREIVIEAIKKTVKEIKGTYSCFLYDKNLDKLFYFKSDRVDFYFAIFNNTLIGSTEKENLNYIIPRRNFYIGKLRLDIIYSVGDNPEKPFVMEGIVDKELYMTEYVTNFNIKRIKRKEVKNGDKNVQSSKNNFSILKKLKGGRK